MNSLPREWGCYDGFPEISDGRKLLPSKAGKHRRWWSYRTRGWAQQTQELGRAARRAPLPRCLPNGARARGAEGPRSRPGTSGELSAQSCFLCMHGPLWLGPLFKGMLTFAWVDDAWTCGNRQTPPGSQQVTSWYDTMMPGSTSTLSSTGRTSAWAVYLPTYPADSRLCLGMGA